jgi:hypothetical protein
LGVAGADAPAADGAGALTRALAALPGRAVCRAAVGEVAADAAAHQVVAITTIGRVGGVVAAFIAPRAVCRRRARDVDTVGSPCEHAGANCAEEDAGAEAKGPPPGHGARPDAGKLVETPAVTHEASCFGPSRAQTVLTRNSRRRALRCPRQPRRRGPMESTQTGS